MNDYSTMTQSELIEHRARINGELHDANKIVSALNEEKDLIDAAIIVAFEAQGTKRAASDVGSVSVTVEEVPNVDDWDALYKHIKETGDFTLLQRRPTSTSMREIWKQGQNIPGVSTRTVKRVNFRSS